MPDYIVKTNNEEKTFRVSNNNKEQFLLDYPDAKLAPTYMTSKQYEKYMNVK